MNNCTWEKIDGFASAGEYIRFVSWIDALVAANIANEIACRKPYYNYANWHERWFVHKGSGEVWRLVEPDFPFAGVFLPVPTSELEGS